MKEIVFDINKMKVFSERDALLRLVLKDLIKRGHGEDQALELIFNSYVLGDSVMEEIYKEL